MSPRVTTERVRDLLAGATKGDWYYNPSKCYRPGENGALPVVGDQEAVFHADGLRTIALTGPADDQESMGDAALLACAKVIALDLLDARRERDELRAASLALLAALDAHEDETDEARGAHYGAGQEDAVYAAKSSLRDALTGEST